MIAIIDLETSYIAVSLVLKVSVVWPEKEQSQQKLNHSIAIQSNLLLSNILPIRVIYSRYILSSDVSSALVTKMVRTPNKMVPVTSISIPNYNSSGGITVVTFKCCDRLCQLLFCLPVVVQSIIHNIRVVIAHCLLSNPMK